MASTEDRGKTAREAVLAYCTSWTQGLYLCCWPEKGARDATMEVMEDASLAVSDEMMPMLRHEIPEQDFTASASVPMGGDNESDLASAAWQGFDPKFPDPTRFDEPAPVPLWVEGRPGKGMPRREVTQDELRHLQLYPERDELSGGGLLFEGLLFFNAAERSSAHETKGSDNAAVEPRSQATDAKPIELADASTATDTPNPQVLTEAHKAEPPSKDLTSATRSKGGKRSRRNPWLEEGIAHIVDMLLADGTPPTYPAVWNWLCANALYDDRYAFEPPISGCDFLYISGDELCFKDQNGNDKTIKRRALERYMPKSKSASG